MNRADRLSMINFFHFEDIGRFHIQATKCSEFKHEKAKEIGIFERSERTFRIIFIKFDLNTDPLRNKHIQPIILKQILHFPGRATSAVAAPQQHIAEHLQKQIFILSLHLIFHVDKLLNDEIGIPNP